MYDTKWLNHWSVKLNIDTTNLILKYSLVWKNPKREVSNYQTDGTRRLSLEAPFISPGSFFQTRLLTTYDEPGPCWRLGTVMHKIRPLPLMSLQHNITLAALRSSLDRITLKISCDLLPRSEYISRQQVNVLWSTQLACTSGVLSSSPESDTCDHRQIPLPLTASVSPSKQSGGEWAEFLESPKLHCSMRQYTHLYSGFPDTAHWLMNRDFKQ